MCSILYILVLSFFVFSALLAFQFFTRKLCLQFSRLRISNFTWNRLPIKISDKLIVYPYCE